MADVASKQRILILSHAYYPMPVGGAEVAIKEITDRIDPQEYEFHLICNGFNANLPKEEQMGNVRVHRIGLTKPDPTPEKLATFPLSLNKPLYQFLAWRTACKLHKQLHFDGLWAMMAHSAGVPAALFAGGHKRVPYLLTLQEGDPLPKIEKQMRPVWPWFTRAFTRARHVQAISSYLAAWARARGAACPMSVVPNGVDVARFSAPLPPEERERIRTDVWQGKPGSVWLITTSRLVHKNGIDTVIDAMKDLPQGVCFAVVGDGPLRQQLHDRALKYGLGPRVRLLGNVPHAALPKYVQAADIFIRPSRSEGMGNSFIEAMAAGVPVIGTQEGGIADFLFDEVQNPDKPTTGFAVPKDEPAMIVRRVKYIIENPDIVAGITKTAREMVERSYDWNHVAARMHDEVFAKVFAR